MLHTIHPQAKITRRTLFKALGLGGVAALLPERARAAALPESGGEQATFLDLYKCVGCGACVDACRQANAARFPEPRKPFPDMLPPGTKPEDFSDRRGDTTRLTPYNWLFIQRAEAGGREVFIPRRCMHCQSAPCAALCPWGAAARHPGGAVAIDASICLGGAKCRDACPWAIPQRQSGVGLYLDLAPRLGGNGVMFKCDRCKDRVAAGGVPACIEACPNAVQAMGPRREIEALARETARRTGGHLYGLDENGGTNTIYLSPVPFKELNAAIGKGPGRPHLASVADTMAANNKLGWAVLLAPLAGAASALLKGARAVTSRKEGSREES
jgi:Fe-S-cluster-containing dehydrogenase component